MLYVMDDGTIHDSRLINWRDIPWSRVIEIEVRILGKGYRFGAEHPGFRGFMNFRWGGKQATYDDAGRYTGHRDIHLWTVGWTDGTTCQLTDLDFFTGDQVRTYAMPLAELRGHIHPDLKLAA